MSSIAKNKLFGSTDGRQIKVVATATAGTLVHTAVTGAGTQYDEIWLWAVNSSATDVKLTIELGGVTSPDDLIEYTVPAEDGLKLVLPGLVVRNAIVIRAFAGTANVVMVSGFINEIRD